MSRIDKLQPGERLANRYSIVAHLGTGGYGSVYRAHDLLLNAEVALKIMAPHVAEDPTLQARFLREVQLTRMVTHPNVVRTFDVGRNEDCIYFTMELVEGKGLDQVLKAGRLPFDRASQVFRNICEGLEAIHNCNIVHRDLKPANIIITDEGITKIADFGIARPRASELTGGDEMLGTVTHMAPEVWRQETPTAQTDIYALGILGFELFTGQLPYPSDKAHELMFQHLQHEPPTARSICSEIPEWLSILIHKMLEKDPRKRPPSIRQILHTLSEGKDTPEKETTHLQPLTRQKRKTGGYLLEGEDPEKTVAAPTLFEEVDEGPDLAPLAPTFAADDAGGASLRRLTLSPRTNKSKASRHLFGAVEGTPLMKRTLVKVPLLVMTAAFLLLLLLNGIPVLWYKMQSSSLPLLRDCAFLAAYPLPWLVCGMLLTLPGALLLSFKADFPWCLRYWLKATLTFGLFSLFLLLTWFLYRQRETATLIIALDEGLDMGLDLMLKLGFARFNGQAAQFMSDWWREFTLYGVDLPYSGYLLLAYCSAQALLLGKQGVQDAPFAGARVLLSPIVAIAAAVATRAAFVFLIGPAQLQQHWTVFFSVGLSKASPGVHELIICFVMWLALFLTQGVRGRQFDE